MRVLMISGRSGAFESYTDSLVNLSTALSNLGLSLSNPHYKSLSDVFGKAQDVNLLLVDLDSPRHIGTGSKTLEFMEQHPHTPVLAYSNCAAHIPANAEKLFQAGAQVLVIDQSETPGQPLNAASIMEISQAIHDLIGTEKPYISEAYWNRRLTTDGKTSGSDIQHRFIAHDFF